MFLPFTLCLAFHVFNSMPVTLCVLPFKLCILPFDPGLLAAFCGEAYAVQGSQTDDSLHPFHHKQLAHQTVHLSFAHHIAYHIAHQSAHSTKAVASEFASWRQHFCISGLKTAWHPANQQAVQNCISICMQPYSAACVCYRFALNKQHLVCRLWGQICQPKGTNPGSSGSVSTRLP